jgi:hypothetical protein
MRASHSLHVVHRNGRLSYVVSSIGYEPLFIKGSGRTYNYPVDVTTTCSSDILPNKTSLVLRGVLSVVSKKGDFI